MQGNSQNYLVRVLIPLAESFFFTKEIRTRNCGVSFPQLFFHGWEVNEDDPFYLPQTLDEIEEFGDAEVAPNSSKKIIQKV